MYVNVYVHIYILYIKLHVHMHVCVYNQFFKMQDRVSNTSF